MLQINGTYTDGHHNYDYVCRVFIRTFPGSRTAGFYFINGVGEQVEVKDTDFLQMLGQQTWFALYRRKPKTFVSIAPMPVHVRDATDEDLAPVLAMPDVDIYLTTTPSDGTLVAIHANTDKDFSILVLKLNDEVWGYRIALPTRDERKEEALRVIDYVGGKLNVPVQHLIT